MALCYKVTGDALAQQENAHSELKVSDPGKTLAGIGLIGGGGALAVKIAEEFCRKTCPKSINIIEGMNNKLDDIQDSCFKRCFSSFRQPHDDEKKD